METLPNIIFQKFFDKMVRDSSLSQGNNFFPNAPNLCYLAALPAHVFFRLGEPFEGPQGVVPGHLDPLHVGIHIGTHCT